MEHRIEQKNEQLQRRRTKGSKVKSRRRRESQERKGGRAGGYCGEGLTLGALISDFASPGTTPREKRYSKLAAKPDKIENEWHGANWEVKREKSGRAAG